jgi:hypothetical protein
MSSVTVQTRNLVESHVANFADNAASHLEMAIPVPLLIKKFLTIYIDQRALIRRICEQLVPRAIERRGGFW